MRAAVCAVATVAVLTACDGIDDFGLPSLDIDEPEPGAEVTEPFELHFDTGVDLGEPGEAPFIRVFVDGLPIGETGDEVFTVRRIDEGVHRIHVSLLDADGEPVGAEDEVTVTVVAAGPRPTEGRSPRPPAAPPPRP